MRLLQIRNNSATLLLCFLFLTLSVQGQETPEYLFAKAKTLAADANYTEAVAVVTELKAQYPTNLDYRLYLAQLYYWQQNYAGAQDELQQIIKVNGNYQDAYDLLLKVVFLRENYDEVMKLALEGKNRFPENKDFYAVQEALALEKLNRTEEARIVLNTITPESKYRKDADYIETELLKKKSSTVSVGHLVSDFENSASALNITHVDYGRKIGSATLISRFSYGATDVSDNLQGEADAYLKIKSKSYLYLNTAVSGDNGIFPAFKAGTEYFQDFKRVTFSVGSRYLHFDNDNNTLLLTGHLGYIMQSWKIEYRHYLAETDEDWFSTSILNLRKNFEATESFVQLDLQYGNLPYYFVNSENFQRLKAYRIGINSKIRLKKNYFIQPVVMFEREEFNPDQFRNRYLMQLILSVRF